MSRIGPVARVIRNGPRIMKVVMKKVKESPGLMMKKVKESPGTRIGRVKEDLQPGRRCRELTLSLGRHQEGQARRLSSMLVTQSYPSAMLFRLEIFFMSPVTLETSLALQT